MPHTKIAKLVNSFQSLSSFDDVASCWLKNRNKMEGFTTLFTFNETGTELPIQSVLGSYDDEKFYLRSIFSKPNIYFIDDYIWYLMSGSGKAIVPIRSVLSFDTQLGKYATKYLKDKAFKDTDIGSSFHKLITYVYENDITFDFVFYLYENFSNYLAGDEKEIKNQLFALKKLADLNRELFLKKRIVKLPYDSKELSKKVEELIESYKKEGHREEYNKKEYLQSNIAAILLKSALLKRQNISNEEKVSKLVTFMDSSLSAILQRELIICSKWLMGEKISFFDPVNGGPGLHELPQKINAMAWDLMLLRHVEQYCSLVEKENYVVAYYVSFDRRMVDVGDIYKNKGCLFPPKSLINQYFMLSELDVMKWIKNIIGEKQHNSVFNDISWKSRTTNKPSPEEVSALRRKLEYKLLKEFSKKNNKAVRGQNN